MSGFSELILGLLEEEKLRPVIFDIGSSGYAQSDHSVVASQSTIVGFEADGRGQDKKFSKGFGDARLINKAVIDSDDIESVDFFLTERPGCSSVLQPDLESLKEFSFFKYFVSKKITSPATSCNRIVREQKLSSIDWLKIDAQGADLKLVKSLSPRLLNDLLVVEVEPGLINAYLDENLFPETQEYFLGQGFWLADLSLQKYTRISTLTKEKYEKKMQLDDLSCFFGTSPTACEARYFRTVKSLRQNVKDPAKLVMAFVFGLTCGHLEYALEVLNLCETSLGRDKVGLIVKMEEIVTCFVRQKQDLNRRQRPRQILKRGIKSIGKMIGI